MIPAVKPDERKALDAIRDEGRWEERERCVRIALEQRCERGTPWDAACVAIANAIRAARRVEMVTAQELNELAARHELALSLNKSDPGFSLSNDDMRMIAAALRQAASERAEIERLRAERDKWYADAINTRAEKDAEIERLRADNEDMKRTLDAPIPWLLERDLRAEIERLTAAAREAEFLLTIAVVPDGHERCKMALTALRAALKDPTP